MYSGAAQVQPLIAAEYNGEDGASSLRYDADLVGQKPTTDIIVNGTAYSPGGRPSTDFPIGLQIGPVRKLLRVRGNRQWKAKWRDVLVPRALRAIPAGLRACVRRVSPSGSGPKESLSFDPRNPVGCGQVADLRHRAGKMLPNLSTRTASLKRRDPPGWRDRYVWSPRREFWGTYGSDWERDRKPLLPADWDPRSRLCAPADQQPKSHLLGGDPARTAESDAGRPVEV